MTGLGGKGAGGFAKIHATVEVLHGFVSSSHEELCTSPELFLEKIESASGRIKSHELSLL